MRKPVDWIEVHLGKVCSIEIGGTPSRGIPAYWDTEQATQNTWVSIKDMHQRTISDTAEKISNSGVKHSNAKLQPKGTVLLSFKLTIGRVAIAGVPLYTNEAIAGLKPTKNLTSEYLYYGLQYWDLLQDVDQAIKGATLNKEKLKRIKFVYPKSVPEQTKIAEILSTVDRAIEQTETLIAKQQRIKTGLMQDLLTRGIDKHGNLRSEQTHQFKDSQLGRVPRSWRVQSLGTALHRAKGHIQTGPFGSQLHAHEYVHEGIPVVMPQDIVDRSISIGSIARVPRNRADDLRRHRTEFNDVVFSRRGDLSRAAAIGEREVGWLCGTGCFLLRVSPDAIHAPWLVDAYRHHRVQRQIDANAIGSTMPSLNNSVMEQLRVAFPGINEQREIARHRQELDATIRTLLDHLLKMRHIKTGLMQQLLTGNRLVTDRVTDNTA